MSRRRTFLVFTLLVGAPASTVWALDAPFWMSSAFPNGDVVDPQAVRFADVDGDGDPDVIGGDGPSGSLWLYRQDRSTGWTFETLADGPDGLRELVVADLDVDGDPDLAGIAANGATGTLFWVENPGAAVGSWTVEPIETLTASAGAFAYHDLEVGDLDGDGRPELVVSLRATLSGADRRCGWWKRSGVGTWTRTAIVDVSVEVLSLAVGDLDGDGAVDLATAGLELSSGDLVVDWWRGAANGVSWTRQPLLTQATESWARVRVGDREGDGDLDVLVAYVPGLFGVGRGVGWRVNDGGGTGWVPDSPVEAPGTFDEISALADLDRDGTLDVVYGESSGALHVFRTDPVTLDLIADEPVPGAVSMAGEVAIGDVDEDGDLDLMAVDGVGDRLVRWLDAARLHGRTVADGAPVAPVVTQISDVVAAAADPVVADLDGNGDLDLVVPSSVVNDTYFFLSFDHGAVWVPGTLPGTLAGAVAAAAGDVDGDGTVDLVVAGLAADEVRLYRNTAGDASTWATVTVGAGVDGVASVVVEDLDRDGDLDVATVALNAGRVDWFRNEGGGATWTPLSIDPAFPFPYGLAAGNFDGDGDVDLVAWGASGLRWYESNLVNHTPPSEGYPDFDVRTIVTGLDLSAAAVLDLDADGDLDVVVNDSVADALLLFENSGEGVFASGIVLLQAASIARVRAADLDHDGRVELLVTRYDTNELIAVEVVAVGSSGLTPPSVWDFSGSFASLWGLTVADLDGNGGDDLVLLEAGPAPGLGWVELDREAVRIELEDLAPVIFGGDSAAFGRLRLTYSGEPAHDPSVELDAVAVFAQQTTEAGGVFFSDFCTRLALHRDAGGAGAGAFDPSDPLLAETVTAPLITEVLASPPGSPDAQLGPASPPPGSADFWLVCDAVPNVPFWLPDRTLRAELLDRSQGTAVDVAGSDVAAEPLVFLGGIASLRVAEPPLFADGFESGDLDAWSAHVP